ncbi:hypothetical protein HPB47_017307 [Ixodes persulcatus]|uniref:Uncharacterized protein n=1 Tax=Ixodes persulcatus TaxID=34615 RepID=A0AC60QNN0_IXOPE|nr:hypothetical protein HPB47_017307 [Ixodes persulcatus]
MLWCLATCSSGQREADFYSTVSRLSDLIDMEKHVKADLVRYVERLKVVQDSILNFVQDRQPYDDLPSPSAVFEYLKHPVHAFHLIKRMTAGLGTIEAHINKTRKFALDCLNISQVALNESFYDRAVEWAEQAIAKVADEEPPTVPKEELDAHHEAAVKQVLRFIFSH